MKTLKNISLFSLFVFVLTAFAFPEGLNSTYSTCSSSSAKIVLKLNQDFTFSYQDFSIANKKVDVAGIYELDGEKVLLTAEDPEINFRDKWKIKDDGKAIVSRKALSLYRLVEQGSCCK